MNREQLHHALRACFGVLQAPYDLVVAGSQAILAHFERSADPDDPMFISQEIDIAIFHSDPVICEEAAHLFSGTLGEGSRFNSSFGFYVDGITLEGLMLAKGWQNRVERVRTDIPGLNAVALSIADIVVAKIIAGRQKDLAFIARLYETGHPDLVQVHELLSTLPESPARILAKQRLVSIESSANARNKPIDPSSNKKAKP